MSNFNNNLSYTISHIRHIEILLLFVTENYHDIPVIIFRSNVRLISINVLLLSVNVLCKMFNGV